jgi:hypothetical protein
LKIGIECLNAVEKKDAGMSSGEPMSGGTASGDEPSDNNYDDVIRIQDLDDDLPAGATSLLCPDGAEVLPKVDEEFGVNIELLPIVRPSILPPDANVSALYPAGASSDPDNTAGNASAGLRRDGAVESTAVRYDMMRYVRCILMMDFNYDSQCFTLKTL